MTDNQHDGSENPLVPLPLHFSNSMALWSTAPLGAMSFMMGTLPLHDDTAPLFDQLASRIKPSEQLAFQLAVAGAANERTQTFIKGVDLYRRHPFRRENSSPAKVIAVAGVSLLDYGDEKGSPSNAIGQPILLIPSLINPASILDLMPGRSLVEALKQAGYRPFLLDWGIPGATERQFTVDDYILKRLKPALDHVVAAAGGPIPVLGYCMGGTLATALACLHPDQIAALILLAAPWDFKADPDHLSVIQSAKLAQHLAGSDPSDFVDFQLLQSYFVSLDPTLTDRKFRRFATLDQNSEAARFFVALECWANSGPPLTGGVIQQVLKDWGEANKPAINRWILGGQTIDPAKLLCPVYIQCPEKDRLVAPKSAMALKQVIPHAHARYTTRGHVGMVVGSGAKDSVFGPVVDWLNEVL